VDNIGISLPGVVDPHKNQVLWLVNYESKWSSAKKADNVESEYEDLNQELSRLEQQFGHGKVSILNDGTAFGISALNGSKENDAIVVTLGTGIGVARITNGAVDVSRIEQSGAFAIDLRATAGIDENCGIRGCFTAELRDSDGQLVKESEFAKKMVTWFEFMYTIQGDRNFILTGGVMRGEYGGNLLHAINRILATEGNTHDLSVSTSVVDATLGGAIGAAQFAAKDLTRNTMEAIHKLNMSLVIPPIEKTKVNHIIVSELLPFSVRSIFENFLHSLYSKYPFLKEEEQIRLVPQARLSETIDQIMAETGRKNEINIALSNANDIAVLPEGVKALVFTNTQENYDFIHLEGIIAALRAMQQKNVGHLIRLYELLTGEEFDINNYTEDEILKKMSDPRELAKIFLFKLKPATALTNSLVLNDLLLRYIEEAA